MSLSTTACLFSDACIATKKMTPNKSMAIHCDGPKFSIVRVLSLQFQMTKTLKIYI